MTTEQVALARAEAETWLGTPWIDRGNTKGFAVDCVHFVAACCKAAGLLPIDFEPPVYDPAIGMFEKSTALEDSILALPFVQSSFVDLPVAEPGDIIIFENGHCSAHVGILLGNNEVWHALINRGVVATQWSLWKTKARIAIRVEIAQ